MMLPEEYNAKCLQIATEALKKIATMEAPSGKALPRLRFGVRIRYPQLGPNQIAQQALNEMRRLP